jgi:carboxymethylenebutenolidase
VGYYVLLPNLYYRRTRDWKLADRSEAAMAEMFAHMHATTIAMAVRDTEAMLRFVDAQPAADARRIGAVGYCMSGPFVMAAGAAFPERFAAIACIHGANMATDAEDSPLRTAARLRCETYVACAEMDKWAPKDDIARLQAALEASGAPHRIEWYPQADHGFVFPKRPAYQKVGAERHWERLFDLFGRTLDARAKGPALP